MSKISCSVPLLTLNSKSSLERLLPLLVQHVEDVFIVDGNSTDGTQAYAQSLGVRVEKQFETDKPNQRIQHFARMRERSWSMARHDWIFWVDADEMPSLDCLSTVRDVVDKHDISTVHRFLRLVQLPDGRVVQHALFYPEYCPRLFHRLSGATLVDRPVHERFILPAGVHYVDHQEPILSQWTSAAHMWQRQRRYVEMDLEHLSHRSWSFLMRWIILYNIRSGFGQLWRAVRASTVALWRGEVALPWDYTFYFLLYRALTIWRGIYHWRRAHASSLPV